MDHLQCINLFLSLNLKFFIIYYFIIIIIIFFNFK